MEHGTLQEYLELTPADLTELDELAKELHEIMIDDKKATIAIVETYQAFCDVVDKIDKKKLIFLLFKNYHLSQIVYSSLVSVYGEKLTEIMIMQRMGASTKNSDKENNGRD